MLFRTLRSRPSAFSPPLRGRPYGRACRLRRQLRGDARRQSNRDEFASTNSGDGRESRYRPNILHPSRAILRHVDDLYQQGNSDDAHHHRAGCPRFGLVVDANGKIYVANSGSVGSQSGSITTYNADGSPTTPTIHRPRQRDGALPLTTAEKSMSRTITAVP